MVESRQPPIATDLVEYLVIVLPGTHTLAALAPELVHLVDSAAVRVLDLVVVTLGAHELPELVEIDSIAGLDTVRDAAAHRVLLLSRHDLELVSLSLQPGECAVVLLAEDRWAQPLTAAARALGGEVRGGERIARERVEATLALTREGSEG